MFQIEFWYLRISCFLDRSEMLRIWVNITSTVWSIVVRQDSTSTPLGRCWPLLFESAWTRLSTCTSVWNTTVEVIELTWGAMAANNDWSKHFQLPLFGLAPSECNCDMVCPPRLALQLHYIAAQTELNSLRVHSIRGKQDSRNFKCVCISVSAISVIILSYYITYQ